MNKNNPDISVSIVNYNSSQYLTDCLKSVAKHTAGLTIEVLIVDNASENFDPSSVYEIFSDAIVTRNEKNIGFACGHNQNFKLSSGDYFFLLNPDTMITQDCLPAMVDIFRRFDGVAVVSPNLTTTDGKNMVTLKKTPTIRSAFLELLLINNILRFFRNKTGNGGHCEKENFREVDCIDGAAFMVRANIYHMLNGLDERFFMYFEEADFCKRLKDIGGKMYFLPGVNMYHLYGMSTIGTDVRQTIYYKSYYKYFLKHYGLFTAMIIRFFIFVGGIIRLLGVQIKYFPVIKGMSLYVEKVVTSSKLILWALGIKSFLTSNNI